MGDIKDVRDGTHDSPKYYDKGYPLITSKNLKEWGLDLSEVNYISKEDYISFNKRSQVNIGDILFGMIGTIGNPVLIVEEKFAIKNVALIKENVNFPNIFLIQMLKSPLFNRFIQIENAGGTQKFISLSKIRGFKLFTPSLEEQMKIGKILRDADKTITLLQRKIDNLKKVKKGLLQKFFPLEQSINPQVRFSGFNQDWEQRNISEISKVFIGLVTTMTSNYSDKGTLLIRNSDIKDGYFEFNEKPIYLTEEFANKNISRMHQVGDVITVHTGDVGTSAVINEKEKNSIGFATIVTRPNQNILSPDFLSTFLNTSRHKNWALSVSTGDGRVNYNLKDYKRTMINVPSIEEQKQISSVIKNINLTITLLQKELEMNNQIKKGFLQKLFPKE